MLTELQLELSAHCNSNCTMCLRDKMRRPKGMMKTEMAFNVIDQSIQLGARLLKPQWFGETLLSYNWQQVVNYAKVRGMRIMLVTNGSLMDESNRKFTLQYVDKVFFSIESHQKDVYERIRRGLQFDVVVGNLKALYEEKQKTKSPTRVYVTAVEIEDNRYDMEGFKDYFNKISDYVFINQDVYCKQPDGVERTIRCSHRVDSRLVVAWDGKCYLCCHDWLGHYEIGDLTKQTVKQVCEGEERKSYLKNLHKLAICQQCMLSSEQ